MHDLIKTLKEILHHYQKIARFQRVKKDEWTLGSDSTVEIILDRVPAEEIEKAVEQALAKEKPWESSQTNSDQNENSKTG